MATIVLESTCIKCKTWINTNQSSLVLNLEPVFISIISEWMPPGSITETDYICQSCWHDVLEIVKTKVTSFSSKYKKTNSNNISDALALKTEHSCSDDDTDNSFLQKAKKIKVENDEDATYTENNSHNNEAYQGEALCKYSEMANSYPYDNKTTYVKGEPPCANDSHDNNTTKIKEEPVNIYDDYIDIEEHDIETINAKDPLACDEGAGNKGDYIISIDNNRTDHMFTSFVNKNTKSNCSNIKQNLLKYVCILCGCPVLKRHTKLTLSNKQNIEKQAITYIMKNSSASKKIDIYRLCSNCQGRIQNNATEIGDSAAKTADPAVTTTEKSNKLLVKQDQQTSSFEHSYDASHTKNIITDCEENRLNICNEESVQPALTEDSHFAIENLERSTPSEIIGNTDIPLDSGEYESVEFLERRKMTTSSDCESTIEVMEDPQSDAEDLHSEEAAKRNAKQHTNDPEWKPSKRFSTTNSSNPNPEAFITLHNYKRAPNTKARCIFYSSIHCSTGRYFKKLKLVVRRRLLKDYNYYVPPTCRVCLNHSKINNWDEIINKNQGISRFTAELIEDLFSLLKTGKQLLSQINFDDISSIDDSIFKHWMGITREELKVLVDKVPEVQNIHRGIFGLTTLLIKHHTGKTNQKLAKLLHIPRTTIERKMKAVQEILNNHCIILEDFLSLIRNTKQQSNEKQKKPSKVSRIQERVTRRKKC